MFLHPRSMAVKILPDYSIGVKSQRICNVLVVSRFTTEPVHSFAGNHQKLKIIQVKSVTITIFSNFRDPCMQPESGCSECLDDDFSEHVPRISGQGDNMFIAEKLLIQFRCLLLKIGAINGVNKFEKVMVIQLLLF